MGVSMGDVVTTFENEEYAKKAAELIKIDATNLGEEFVEQPNRYAYFAVQTANAKRRYAQIEFEFDTLYATLDAEKRIAAKSVPTVKYTEQMYKNEVVTDQRYQLKHKELIAAEHTVNVMQAIRNSFEHRKDMLMQLGASDRVGVRDPRSLDEAAVERHKARKG
jgi:hypothetical protein